MARQVRIGVLAACVLAACGAVSGSGDLVTEEREVPAFIGVAASSGVNVRIVIESEVEPTVTVTYDDNLLEFIRTEVEDSVLEVGIDGSVSIGSGGIRVVEVVVPALEKVEATSGANLSATGRLEALAVVAESGANLALGELRLVEASVDASSGANVSLRVSGSVFGSASSGANVTIAGFPRTVEVETETGANLNVE
jgi:hypothetical protein